MEINEQDFYVNKTKKYLLPLIKDFGHQVINQLDRMFKLAIGIDDAVIPRQMNLNNHLFILIHTKKKPEKFIQILNWMKKQPFFEFDYAFDDIIEGHQQMIVLKLSEIHKEKHDNFTNNKFSAMYTESEALKYFSKDGKRYKMLTREDTTVQEFVTFINNEYDTDFDYKEWKNEIELPIKQEEEIFNYNLIFNKNARRKEKSRRSVESRRGTTAKRE